MREAFEQMAYQNDYLSKELKGTTELLEQQKKQLDEALANQSNTVQKCAESGTSLMDKIDEQAQYLKQNRDLLDTSQISMATTMDASNTPYTAFTPMFQAKPIMKNKKIQTLGQAQEMKLANLVEKECQTEDVTINAIDKSQNLNESQGNKQ